MHEIQLVVFDNSGNRSAHQLCVENGCTLYEAAELIKGVYPDDYVFYSENYKQIYAFSPVTSNGSYFLFTAENHNMHKIQFIADQQQAESGGSDNEEVQSLASQLTVNGAMAEAEKAFSRYFNDNDTSNDFTSTIVESNDALSNPPVIMPIIESSHKAKNAKSPSKPAEAVIRSTDVYELTASDNSANVSDSVQSVAQVSINDSNKISLAPLPFYDIKRVIVEPKRLIATQQTYGQRKIESISFQISNELFSRLYATERSLLPRYELQMRMALYNPGTAQMDEFPNGVSVKMNGIEVSLPKLVKVTNPNRFVMSKRDPQPINLSEYCNREVFQKLVVEWQNETRSFVIGVWLVRHINAAILHDRFLKNCPDHYAETKKMIKSYLGGNPKVEGISMDSMKISLLCPVSRSKMALPVRSLRCTHIQCFDLDNYLAMNEARSTWKCPICNKSCPLDSLVVDRYFIEIIQTVDKDVVEVELLVDGNWKLVGAKQTIQPAIKKETKAPIAYYPGYSKVSKPARSKFGSIANKDNDFSVSNSPKRLSAPINQTNIRKPTPAFEVSPNGIPVITLSDSDN